MNKPLETNSALVTPAWLLEHQNDPKVRLIEIAGMSQPNMEAYKAGHALHTAVARKLLATPEAWAAAATAGATPPLPCSVATTCPTTAGWRAPW